MHRILVEEELDLGRALPACAQLLRCCCRDEAQQLATYIGWLLPGTAGGIMAGVLFIVPGVIAIMGLSTSTRCTATSASSKPCSSA
jgi:chromate transporter